MQIKEQGQFLQADFFSNVGGINISDSTFAVKDDQATDGSNFDYVKTGGIQRSRGPSKINSSPNAVLRTTGTGVWNTKASSKQIIRSTNSKLQTVDILGTFVNLTNDTSTAGSDFFSSTDPVVMKQFNTADADLLFMAGGGLAKPAAVYSATKATAIGAAVPTGAVGSSVSGSTGTWSTTGNYRYAFSLKKASTNAESNVALDIGPVNVAATTSTVVLDFTGLTSLDTTKYDTIVIYRSAVSGVSGFTTGDIVAEIATTTTSYTDTGSFLEASVNVPRANNTNLDNSELPSGTYETLAVFKRRLVTASGSRILISDINKPESFPAVNYIDIPSGGKITALGIISFTTPTTTGTDEFLAIFKENELWVVTGDDIDSFELKFIDYTGCPAQQLLVETQGYLYWVDYRGIHMWAGSGKPVYVSRVLEPLWSIDGDLDLANLRYGWGAAYRRSNQVVWCLAHNTLGVNKFLIKLDLRLTLPSMGVTMSERIVDGVFTYGKTQSPIYGGSTFIFPVALRSEEIFVAGDDAGYVYRMFYDYTGTGNDADFSYVTKYLDMGDPNTAKQFQKVIAWVDETGNFDLTLDFWTDFRGQESNFSSIAQPISVGIDGTTALWDVAYWDQANWDGFVGRQRAIVFNLRSGINNVQGDCIRLRFKNQNSNEPVTINGFSVIYTNTAMRK